MSKTMVNFTSVLAAVALTLLSAHGVSASEYPSPLQAGNLYYVSPVGSDTNSCTAAEPCATFSRALSLAAAGDTIIAQAGTYNEALIINKSGITVEGIQATITASPQGIRVEETAQNVTIRGFTVTGSVSHGIYVKGQNVTVENNVIYHNVLENGSISNGAITCYDTAWGSAIKVGLGGSNVTIRGNTVYNNCGEGIATTRGSNILIENNTVYDNKSVNIYVDNSFNVQVLNNTIYCAAVFPKGVALGEEFYDGWGAQLHDVTVSGNSVTNCQTGIMAFSSDVGGTLTNVTISNNNLPSAQKRGLSLDNSANSNVLVSNNIHFNDIWVRSPAGVTLTGNTKVGSTTTSTPTATATATTTATSTPAPTNTATPTVTVTATASATATQTPPPAPVETTFDNTNSAFVYSSNWYNISNSKAYGGNYKETTVNGSSVSFTFTGQSFSVLYTGGPAFRSMNVYVDNVLVGKINQNASTRTYRLRWDYTGQLSYGQHVLKLVFVTTKATNTKGSIDAVIVR